MHALFQALLRRQTDDRMTPLQGPRRNDTVPVMADRGSTWITRLEIGTSGYRVAVKDLIDVAGIPTTAGCRAVAERAVPAVVDAACLTGLRVAVEAGRAIIAGKANLHELADGISGVNVWFGTPVNPIDPARVPGGSSSGSATAVGGGDAELAFGTDTGGSVRIPAACCGIAGLKTSYGRISTDGVWPLAPSLDTVGPMAADVAGLVSAMALLEPGFRTQSPQSGPVARLRVVGTTGQPWRAAARIERAIDAALAATEWTVEEVDWAGWEDAGRAALHVIGAESAAGNRLLLRDHPDGISDEVRAGLEHGARVGNQALLAARSLGRRWRSRLETDLFSHYAAAVIPVLDDLAPRLDGDLRRELTVRWTAPVNLAGLPSLALPIPLVAADRRGADTPVPASLQLIGPPGSEESLLALGRQLEDAVD